MNRHRLKRRVIWILLSATFTLGFAEWTARRTMLLMPRGGYWADDAKAKFEPYRLLTLGDQAPEIVIVGDSTGARDFDPLAIEAALPANMRVYNLAYPGNFPRAFKLSTLPLLKFPHAPPRLVILSFAPNAFFENQSTRKSEDQILDSPICRERDTDRWAWTRLAVSNLGSLRANWQFWKRDAVSLPKDRGFLLLEGSGPTKPAKLLERSRYDASEQRDHREYARAGTLADDAPIPDAARLDVVRDLATLARDRGFRLLVIVPPHLEMRVYGRPHPIFEAYREAIVRLGVELGFHVLDWNDPPFLDPEDYYDWGHLNRIGAAKMSAELANLLSRDW